MNPKDDFTLTIDQVAERLQKPPRFVREKLIKTGALPHFKLGGNSIRIRPEDYRAFIRTGQTGFRHAKPSGRAATA